MYRLIMAGGGHAQLCVLKALARVVGMDAKRRRVALPDGTLLDYDGLSLDVGSETE